jgi:hypothetical protein
MMKRSLRRLVAVLGILGISLAQLAATANACGLAAATGHANPLPAVAAGAAGVPDAAYHCGGHAPGPNPALPASNLCEVHCSDAATPAAVPDVPAVTLAVLPAPVLPLESLAVAAAPPPAEALARAGAPPIVIAFGRLLI